TLRAADRGTLRSVDSSPAHSYRDDLRGRPQGHRRRRCRDQGHDGLSGRAHDQGGSGMTASANGAGQVMLKVENISLSFGGVRAIQNVSFDIVQGEIRAIIGPNGAGKT